jgi:RNA polymerase sigma-70 factor (ECF subfamily)
MAIQPSTYPSIVLFPRISLGQMDTPKTNETTTGSPVRSGDGQEALADLIRSTADGDQQAFAELYRLTSRRVYGMARRVLIDAELAQDAAQEVYLQIWQNAAKFDAASGSPLAWLMTIAHRRAVDKVRSAQSSADREAKYGATSQSIEHDEVADAVSDRIDAESVVKCLATLTDTQQESVKLAYYGGLTYREVAEKLGAAVPTVKSRIRDGLLRLKSCLEVN